MRQTCSIRDKLLWHNKYYCELQRYHIILSLAILKCFLLFVTFDALAYEYFHFHRIEIKVNTCQANDTKTIFQMKYACWVFWVSLYYIYRFCFSLLLFFYYQIELNFHILHLTFWCAWHWSIEIKLKVLFHSPYKYRRMYSVHCTQRSILGEWIRRQCVC